MEIQSTDKINDSKGAFVRKDAVFRHWIKEGTKFAPESNRYHLYVAYACPWASRCLALYHMKGLEDVIGLSITHPTWQRTNPDSESDTHTGWVFRNPNDPPLSNTLGHGSYSCEGCVPDSVNGAKTIREIYERCWLAEATQKGTCTIPFLWDKKLNTIVNNESSEINVMLNSEFNQFCKHPELDLNQQDLKEEMEKVNEWIYTGINNGVYRCGFAKSQIAYQEAFDLLFLSMDRLEELLSKQRYVCGPKLTLSDVAAFVTLIRFDEVYVVYFKTNKKMVRNDYPNIFNYIKEIYQFPGVAKSVNMTHIKMTYYTSHPHLNTYGIIPIGCPDDWSSPHNRERSYVKQ